MGKKNLSAALVAGLFVLSFAAFTTLGVVPVSSAASSQTLYGCTSNHNGLSSLFTIDTTTGAATFVGQMGTAYGCSALAYSSSGTLYAMAVNATSNTTLFTVNTATGAATPVGPSNQGTACNGNIGGGDFSPGGTLYAVFVSYPVHSPCLATLNPSNGAETDIGLITCCTAIGAAGNSLAINSSGTIFFSGSIPTEPNYTNSLYTLSSTTSNPVGNLTGFPEACNSQNLNPLNAMVFDSSGTLYGILNCYSYGSYLVTINTSNAAMTVIGQTNSTMDGIAFTPISSPPPPSGVPEFPIASLSFVLLVALLLPALLVMSRKFRARPAL